MAKETSSKSKKGKPKTKPARKPKKKTDPYLPKIKKLPASKVLAGLEKSGFPLELSVRKILRDSGWRVRVNRPFIDRSSEPYINRSIPTKFDY
jgi:hypothetical protein